MFYQIQVARITSGGVIDVQGKELSLIGNKRVKAGDVVWTDGKVIFGHTPIRGGGVLYAESSGIPVLADNDLRGYFTKTGNYKSYKIKGDEWIVNDKNIYAHEVSDEELIDAEIADDGSVYTVMKEINQLEDNDEDFYYRYHHDKSAVGFLNPEWLAYSVLDCELPDSGYFSKKSYGFSLPADKADFVKRDESIVKECEIAILKNETEVTRINFDNVIKHAENLTEAYLNLEGVTESPLSLLAHSNKKCRAILYNFKILSSDNYTYLLRVETWVERYHTSNTKYISSSIAVLGNFLFKVTAGKNIETIAQTIKRFPFLFFSSAGTFALGTSVPSIPKPNFPYTEVIAVTGPVSYVVHLYKVWDSTMLPNADEYKKGVEEIDEVFSFPIQDGYQAKISNVNDNIDYWKFSGFVDGNNNQIIAAIPSSNAHKWNMSLAKLRNGYLFGIHQNKKQNIDGALYLIKDGTAKEISSALKNFRLRELKPISKAKK